MRLLAGALSAAEVERFLNIARGRSISAVCEQDLSNAKERFGTTFPDRLMEGRSPLHDHGRHITWDSCEFRFRADTTLVPHACSTEG